ncbi:MAG: ABC transporter ATP-binding protein [Bacteriovoracaceae bacterium]|nr:ABC transporter ATP-binding protein [Bacteriovoracaceae bacterium]
MNYKNLKRYWQIVFSHPLHFFAAYIAALLCNFLLTLQPGFVKVFINEASRGVDRSHLVSIALYMALALVLAFVFDTLQVTTSLAFKLKVEQILRDIHHRHCKYHSQGQINLTVQKGIFGLMEFTIITSLEAVLVISSILMVTIFMIFEDKYMGGTVFFFVSLGVIINLKITQPLGRIARFKEVVKARMIKKFKQSDEQFEHSISRLQKYEYKRFFLDTIFVFSSFATFRLLPSVILIAVALYMEKSIGGIASLFLYFNLLHKPYIRLITLVKQAVLYYSQASLFRDGLEAGLDYENYLGKLPFGLVISTRKAFAGAPLSGEINSNSVIYSDELSTEVASEETIKKLLDLAKKETVLLFTQNETLIKQGHFHLDENGVLKTIPLYLEESNYA